MADDYPSEDRWHSQATPDPASMRAPSPPSCMVVQGESKITLNDELPNGHNDENNRFSDSSIGTSHEIPPHSNSSATSYDIENSGNSSHISEREAHVWHPVLSASNQVVLYNPTSHALVVQSHDATRHRRAETSALDGLGFEHGTNDICPFCQRPYDVDMGGDAAHGRGPMGAGAERNGAGRGDAYPMGMRMGSGMGAHNYFQLLEESASRPVTPIHSLRSSISSLASRNQSIDDPLPASSSPPSSSPSLSRNTSNLGVNRKGKSKGKGRVDSGDDLGKGAMAEGYFQTFFKEEYRLGMGASGAVYLCQHVLDGNPLGYFAVKKIAVGQSHSYLLKILKEVRLLESFRHPNIVTYHHAWLESCQFSSFGPRVPTLFVLMQWAEGGSLDDFIDSRLGRRSNHSPVSIHRTSSLSPSRKRSESSTPSYNLENAEHSRSARIRAFRAFQKLSPQEREAAKQKTDEESRKEGEKEATRRRMAERGRGVTTAVHLLSAEEVRALFGDVVRGLGFLHSRSILHLDLKPGNVLLTWDEGKLIPRAMLSDFGTSQDMMRPSSTRSGNTGTLEYTAPETLRSPITGLLSQVDSKADMWSLGMVLHKMLFFRLPYKWSSDGDRFGFGYSGEADGSNRQTHKNLGERGDGGDFVRLESEVLSYPGFKHSATVKRSFASRGIPQTYAILLESLLNTTAGMRPSSEKILKGIMEGKLDPVPKSTYNEFETSSDANGVGDAMAVVTRQIPRLHSPPISISVSPPQTTGDEQRRRPAPGVIQPLSDSTRVRASFDDFHSLMAGQTKEETSLTSRIEEPRSFDSTFSQREANGIYVVEVDSADFTEMDGIEEGEHVDDTADDTDLEVSPSDKDITPTVKGRAPALTRSIPSEDTEMWRFVRTRNGHDLLKLVKSVILVFKIMSLLHLTSASRTISPDVLHSSPSMLIALVCLAVSDIWVDSLWINLGLGLGHVLGLWWVFIR